MMMTKDRLTLAEFKHFLRAHVRDKSSAELSQELSNVKQQEREDPQQFNSSVQINGAETKSIVHFPTKQLGVSI